MSIDQLGDAGCRVGVRVAAGGLAHGPEARRIAEQRIELLGQPLPGALGIGEVHGHAHADHRLGIRASGGPRGAGEGHRIAGTPVTSNSATVMAPARVTHTSAAAYRSGMRSSKGTDAV